MNVTFNTAAGQGGDHRWAKNTQTGMGALDIGNGVKAGMIDYAVGSFAGKSLFITVYLRANSVYLHV